MREFIDIVEGGLRQALIRLDMALTGKPQEECARTAANQAVSLNPEAFLTMNDAYYLSDGGYSRIKASDETGRLSLMSQSRDAVKARWSDAGAEIAAVEHVLRDFLQEQGLLDA